MKRLLFLIISIKLTLFAQTFPPYIPINSGDAIEDHVDYLEKKYYELQLDKTQTATIQLSNLDADIDLYVAINRRASIQDNDCFSSNGKTADEKCIITSIAPEGKKNDIIILVYGFKSSNYKLKISTKEGAEEIPQISNIPIDGSLKKGESKQYKFSGKKGQTYTTTLSSLTDDVDLRVKVGKKAGFHSFDCKSTNGGTKKDECSVTLTKDDTVYVHVYGYKTADYKISLKELDNQNQALIAKAKQHCLNKDESTNLVLCSNEKETVYILTNDIDYDKNISYHALYRVIIASENESVTLLSERSKPIWDHPYINEYFIKKLENTLIYGTVTVSQEADPRGSFNFRYKDKILLNFPYLEGEKYLRKKYTSNNGSLLHIEYYKDRELDSATECKETYDISDPQNPKAISKECTPLYK